MTGSALSDTDNGPLTGYRLTRASGAARERTRGQAPVVTWQAGKRGANSKLREGGFKIS